MEVRSILSAVLDVAKAAAPLVGPAGPAAVSLAEDLGGSVVKLIDKIDEAIDGGVTPELVAVRADLDKRIAQINAGVDDTVRRLRGED